MPALHPGRRRGAARPRYRSPPGAGGGLGHGLGYPPERLLYIFDRFYHSEDTPPEKSRYAGLGLAIVKRILELHGSGEQPRGRDHLQLRPPVTR
ncbi:MAG: hypothetical protein ACREV3_09345 [Gammaproteobacteria bacterium]